MSKAMQHTMRVHILGCGSSGGVPLISGNWGQCNPENPKNRRTRASILVQLAGKNILIDTSPDLRQQLLRAKVNTIDAVLLTHAHADHCHGLDELRQIFFHQGDKIPIYADTVTLQKVQTMFSYMFFSPDSFYPDYLVGHAIEEETIAIIDGVTVVLFEQLHGHQRSSGFRIDNMAYSTDVKHFPWPSERHLENLDLWIVDCLRYEEHQTHAHFDLAMRWVEKYKPRKTILTHMCEHLDYDDLLSRCPQGVTPAFDGMVIHISPRPIAADR